MKRFDANLTDNPVFNTVNGLSNRTFDPDNIVSGRGATEDQLKVVGDKVKEVDDYITESGCCENDPYQEMINQLRDRIDALETQIEECCSGACFDGGGTSTCDGNTITVSFTWNGTNPFTDGGQATAISADTTKSIVAFFFLAYDSQRGVYYKRTTAWGQDWVWNIDTSGAVTASAGGTGFNPPALGIIAVDENGCEGMVPVSLPSAYAGG